jgi:SET domain
LWPEQEFNGLGEAPAAKRQKTAHKLVDSTVSLLPPPTSGTWTSPTSAVTYPSGSTPGAAAQRLKLHRHLEQVATYIPRLASGLLSPTSPKYWRFVHMWCCVNSRCFYYLHPRQSKPSDPNEAIAIAPGMDLFNHTDNPGCSTKYDKNGYTVVADRSYDAGEEVQLNYGPHANDVLWSEYGFLTMPCRSKPSCCGLQPRSSDGCWKTTAIQASTG